MTLATDQLTGEGGLGPKAQQFLSLRETVMDHWERMERERVDGARNLIGPVLTNALPAFFDNIAEAVSPAHPRPDGASYTNSPAAHGSERARLTPFGPDQVVHEYQIFREAIGHIASERMTLDASDWSVIDTSINRATREAIRAFTAGHEEFRRKVAALSHDRRTPLAVIASGAQLVGIAPDIDMARRTASAIERNAAHLHDILEELLEALTMPAAAKLPLSLSRFDALDLAREVGDQYRQAHDQGHERALGHWCRRSLRRALENLLTSSPSSRGCRKTS